MSADDPLEHIRRLSAKRQRLELAQVDAELQFCQHAAREWSAGRLDYAELYRLYRTFRELALSGFGQRWVAAVGITAAEMYHRGRHLPNSTDGQSWVGVAPLPPGDTCPPAGVSVVYVLYDAELVPCYIGSTGGFRDRLKQHLKDGKPAARWVAYPCDSREAAYVLEDRLLREHKPYCNRRAAR